MDDNKNIKKRVKFVGGNSSYEPKSDKEEEKVIKSKNDTNLVEKSENQNLEEKQKSPTYEYILSSVEKELNEGLTLLLEKRPPDPIKFLGNFLLEKSKNYK